MKARGTLAALLPVALVVLLGLLSACGGDSDSSAADPAETATSTPTDATSTPTSEPTETTSDETTAPPDSADWPACETVWVEGGKIPGQYRGCLEGDTAVAADNLSCSSGQRIVRYQDKFYGVAGGKIYQAAGPLEKDKQYLKMVSTCRA
jgi:hypothetical protein